VLYPARLTRTVQLTLGGFALVVNVLIYRKLVVSRSRSAGASGTSPELTGR
jgi:hypothetical protein